MVQFEDANRIEREWIANGSPYCEHPSLDKEYSLGMDSGDRRCLNCGDTFTRSEWKAGKLEPRGGNPDPSAPHIVVDPNNSSGSGD